MEKYQALKSQVIDLENDVAAFYNKGNKSAGTRIRKGLQSIKVLSQNIRKEISAKKKS